jgi:hypothetical protein
MDSLCVQLRVVVETAGRQASCNIRREHMDTTVKKVVIGQASKVLGCITNSLQYLVFQRA